MSNEKRNIINWARSCHYDGCIVIKEIKGGRWMSVLSYIEVKFDFNIDDFPSIDDSWKKILEVLNSLDSNDITKINSLRYGY